MNQSIIESKGMERFTDRARKVVHLAKQEAGALDHNYIGTEHLLLGLLVEGSGVACSVLKNLGLTSDAVRAEVMRLVKPEAPAAGGSIDKLIEGAETLAQMLRAFKAMPPSNGAST